jgi:16S rRNA (guanine1516-N2)-methyltransferase
MLIRAIGFRQQEPPLVLDATGGLGRDAFLMAGRGCRVHLVERNSIVAALLQDGLQRAAKHPATRDACARIRVSTADSLQIIRDGGAHDYDVIYLDPMYPERTKSALAKKDMQVLQQLLGRQDDAGQLLAAALETGAARVVVKRPRTVPPLAAHPPSHSLGGKTTRFDVYLAP